MNTRMEHKACNLFWIKLLTFIWLTASIFAYPNALYVKYIEPDKQQDAIEVSSPAHHWYFLDVDDEPIELMENFWRLLNIALVHVSGVADNVLNLSGHLQYRCLNQTISLISFQYFHSALPA